MAPEWEMLEPGRGALDQNRSRRLNCKAKGPGCPSCRVDGVCEGPWAGYARLFGFDEFRPVAGARVSSPSGLARPGRAVL
jgi:hypothetical protein